MTYNPHYPDANVIIDLNTPKREMTYNPHPSTLNPQS